MLAKYFTRMWFWSDYYFCWDRMCFVLLFKSFFDLLYTFSIMGPFLLIENLCRNMYYTLFYIHVRLAWRLSGGTCSSSTRPSCWSHRKCFSLSLNVGLEARTLTIVMSPLFMAYIVPRNERNAFPKAHESNMTLGLIPYLGNTWWIFHSRWCGWLICITNMFTLHFSSSLF